MRVLAFGRVREDLDPEAVAFVATLLRPGSIVHTGCSGQVHRDAWLLNKRPIARSTDRSACYSITSSGKATSSKATSSTATTSKATAANQSNRSSNAKHQASSRSIKSKQPSSKAILKRSNPQAKQPSSIKPTKVKRVEASSKATDTKTRVHLHQAHAYEYKINSVQNNTPNESTTCTNHETKQQTRIRLQSTPVVVWQSCFLPSTESLSKHLVFISLESVIALDISSFCRSEFLAGPWDIFEVEMGDFEVEKARKSHVCCTELCSSQGRTVSPGACEKFEKPALRMNR